MKIQNPKSKIQKFTHLDQKGKAQMVDIKEKEDVFRQAIAKGSIKLDPKTILLINKNQIQKGDVLSAAKIAGISAAKKTSDLIPLCHPLLLTKIDLNFRIEKEGIGIESIVECIGKTGVEMEALTAVSIAALTIYDMCKAVDKNMVIGDIYLWQKSKTLNRVEDPGRVEAICISGKKGEKKKAIDSAVLVKNFGIEGDAHAGSKRQISLLSIESIQKMKDKGLKVAYGDFAENIATSGIDLISLKIGTQIQISNAVLEITEIGKVCKTPCSIFYQVGDCVMPKEGVFANVIKGGEIKKGDEIRTI